MNLVPSSPVHLRSSLTLLFDIVNPGTSVVEYARSVTRRCAGRTTFNRPMSTSLFFSTPKTALKPASVRMSTYLCADVLLSFSLFIYQYCFYSCPQLFLPKRLEEG